MQALVLKAGATLLTLLSALGSAGYVSGHVKNGSAPLHPPVVFAQASAGQLVITAQVHTSHVEAVTSTYAS